MDNGREILALERWLGLDVEAAAHLWASGVPGLMAAANVVYLWAHVPMTGGALLWVRHHRPGAFAAVRDVFLLTHLLTVAGYLLHPTAPPRLMGRAEFGDTFASLWGAGAQAFAHTVQSPYAAMPSGHVAWALIAGGAMAALVRQRPLRVLCALYPVLVTAVTVVTANHFLLDAVAAAGVVGVAALAVALTRLRWAPAAPDRMLTRRRAGRPGPAGAPAGGGST